MIDFRNHNVSLRVLELAIYTSVRIPVYPQKIVGRFAKARMMIYKKPPMRNLSTDKKSKEYKDLCYRLDTTMREFAETTWLVKDCLLYSYFNKLKERMEYTIVPIFNEYYLEGDPNNVWGYSFEITCCERLLPHKTRL